MVLLLHAVVHRPVMWVSKVPSVAFAHPKIGEAHPDCSSGAVETFGAGNATYDCLHVSYSSEEMGIRFDTPFDLLMDNSAAEVFAKNSAFKARMKHIDARQRWVKVLRDRNIVGMTLGLRFFGLRLA